MMYRLTNLARSTRIVHSAKKVPVPIPPDGKPHHVELITVTALAIKRFQSSSLRIEPLDEEASEVLGAPMIAQRFGNSMVRAADNDPEPVRAAAPEVVTAEEQVIPKSTPQEDWDKAAKLAAQADELAKPVHKPPPPQKATVRTPPPPQKSHAQALDIPNRESKPQRVRRIAREK